MRATRVAEGHGANGQAGVGLDVGALRKVIDFETGAANVPATIATELNGGPFRATVKNVVPLTPGRVSVVMKVDEAMPTTMLFDEDESRYVSGPRWIAGKLTMVFGREPAPSVAR